MKKSVKVVALIFLSLAAIILCAIAAYFTITADAKLDKSKLINYNQTITILDENGEKIESSSVQGNRSTVLIGDLSEDTKNAFIASEDRQFYRHHGLNYKRMLKALFKNIASFSFKEGASTISQQLIKNTHLSNDKTLTRKLKEIRLTKQLEKAYTKDEILEMYLNTIYFGHSCYGLQSAANFYFDTAAEDLTLEQSATLAGLLTSPNNYSPFKNAEKCLNKRNTVLKSMYECNFISAKKYEEAIKKPLGEVHGGATKNLRSYIDAVTDEIDELNLDYYNQLSGCKVYTYINPQLQSYIENIQFDNDGAIVITDKNNGVCAYRNTIDGAKRQPGSTIKPLIVYAPAIEEGIAHTFTKIDDSKINFGGYSPENYDKKYHGMVTVAQSIAQSYNVPAVKILNSLTVKRAAEYAKKLNITLDKEDMNLSLALGGMKYGADLKSLCDAYSTFRNGGRYTNSYFIKEIVDKNGVTIYSAPQNSTMVFSQGTCSLMNDMLMQTAQAGTAKKLKNLPYDIAAKTGTCGNEEGNTDAYAVAYTSEHTFGIWLGDKDNAKTAVTGGGQCCNIAKEIVEKLYSSQTPPPLDVKSGTVEVEIDRQDYDSDGKIILSDDICPKLNKLSVRCLNGMQPQEKSTKFTHPAIAKPKITLDDGKISIVLCKTQYYSYLIKRDNETIYDGKYMEIICDEPGKGSHLYTVTPYYVYEDKKYCGDTLTLSRINITHNTQSPLPPPITQKDWFNN